MTYCAQELCFPRVSLVSILDPVQHLLTEGRLRAAHTFRPLPSSSSSFSGNSIVICIDGVSAGRLGRGQAAGVWPVMHAAADDATAADEGTLAVESGEETDTRPS